MDLGVAYDGSESFGVDYALDGCLRKCSYSTRSDPIKCGGVYKKTGHLYCLTTVTKMVRLSAKERYIRVFEYVHRIRDLVTLYTVCCNWAPSPLSTALYNLTGICIPCITH